MFGPIGRTRARSACMLLVPLVVSMVVVGGSARMGAAHSAVGTLGIEALPGSEPLTAKVRALLEFVNDGHPVPGAVVSASAVGPSGSTIAPVPLSDSGDGLYEGTLTMPVAGQWTVTVTAVEPAATTSATVDVADTARAPVPTTSPPDAPSTTRVDRFDRSEADGSGSNDVILVVAGIAFVGLLVGGAVLVLRSRRTSR